VNIRTKQERVTIEGDTIEVGVSHEIKIGGESSWISFKYSTKVQPEETDTQARDRAVEYTDEGVWHAIERSVATIREKGKA
jgi:hypothetical protein